MAYNPQPSPGQKQSSESAPVVVAYDQPKIPVDPKIGDESVKSILPGIQVITLVDENGDPIKAAAGGLLVNDVNGGDAVIGGAADNIVRAQRTAGGFAEYRFMSSAAAAFTPWFDASAYRSVSVHQVTGTNGAVFQGSNDGANAVGHSLISASNQTTLAAASSTGGTPGIYAGTLRCRYFRLSLSAVANTVFVITFFSEPMDNNAVPAAPTVNTPAMAGAANSSGALGATENMVNEPSIAGAIGSWFPMVDIGDGRFNPAVTQATGPTYTHAGTGIVAAGMVGQFDDVAQQVPAENSMARVRVSKKRSLLGEIRDGSVGQAEVGVKVTPREALLTEDLRSDQFGDVPIVQVTPGVQGVTLVGPTGDPLGDQNGGLLVSVIPQIASRTTFADFGANAAGVIDTLPGVLLAIIVTNANAGLRYLQIFNQSVTPIAGAIPRWSIPIPAGTAVQPGSVSLGSEFLGPSGTSFPVGVAWGVSTTVATFTAATAADHTVNGAFL